MADFVGHGWCLKSSRSLHVPRMLIVRSKQWQSQAFLRPCCSHGQHGQNVYDNEENYKSKSPTLPAASRRITLQAIGLVLFCPQESLAQSRRRILSVGEGDEYKSIGDALRVANDGDMIAIAPGLYREQVVVEKSVKILARQGDVTLEWRSNRPYESAFQCIDARCEVRGLNIVHASPSVANNYAVINQGGDLRIESCSVNSTTGAGVGSEGGVLTIRESNISNNRGNGVVCVATLNGQGADCKISGSRIGRNNLNGILAREDSRLSVRDSAVSYNRQFGVQIKGAEFQEEGNVYAGNSRGAIKETS